MSTSNIPHSEQPKQTKFLSPWLAYPLAFIVWWALPWAISLLTPHYGWAAGRPGLWNLLGLIPVLTEQSACFGAWLCTLRNPPKGSNGNWTRAIYCSAACMPIRDTQCIFLN